MGGGADSELGPGAHVCHWRAGTWLLAEPPRAGCELAVVSRRRWPAGAESTRVSQPWGSGMEVRLIGCLVKNRERDLCSPPASVRSVHSGKQHADELKRRKCGRALSFRMAWWHPDEQLWRGGRQGPLGRRPGAGEAREEPRRSACEQSSERLGPGGSAGSGDAALRRRHVSGFGPGGVGVEKGLAALGLVAGEGSL